MKVSIFDLLGDEGTVPRPTASSSAIVDEPTDPTGFIVHIVPETILDLWRERTKEIFEEHPDANLRFCQLAASAHISLIFGDYAGRIIRPHVTV